MGASGYTQAFTLRPDSGLRGPGIRRRRNCCRRGDRSFSPWSSWFPPLQSFSIPRLKLVFTSGEMAMFRLSKWVVFGLAVWMLAAREAKAGVGFQPVSPDELKHTSQPQATGAAAIFFYRQGRPGGNA